MDVLFIGKEQGIVNYKEDLNSQFDILKEKVIQKKIIDNFQCSEKAYNVLYVINYFSNRVELRRDFSDDYFKMTFSCLIEATVLLTTGYPRATLLTLRNGIDFFTKFIIHHQIHSDELCREVINPSRYTPNKGAVDRILKIKSANDGELWNEYKSINSKLESKYTDYSQLVHDLYPNTRINIASYFDEAINQDLVVCKNVGEALEEVFKSILFLMLIIQVDSLKNWDSDVLREILSLCLSKGDIKKVFKWIHK